MVSKFKKKQTIDHESILSNAIKKVRKDTLEKDGKVLDIIFFAKELLNVKLYPAQEIICKFIYAGTRFNEHLEITDEDLETIANWDVPQPWLYQGERSKIQILRDNIEKFKHDPRNSFFRDVVLILGRRSGKSFISALIAVYEAYKLIMLKDPLKFYAGGEGRLGGDIWIINTAITGDQAKSIVFRTIKQFIYECPVFDGRISSDKSEQINILTDYDISRNKKIKKAGGKEIDGTVVIASGNSNSPALRGHATICCVFDEMAHYVDSDGKASAEEVYTAIEPSCSTFYKFGDGRNIVISTPDLPLGFFYEHYINAKTVETMLLFQIATWDANPNHTKDSLKDKYEKNPDRAAAEYGSQFRRSGGDIFIPHNLIDLAMTKREGWLKQEEGSPIIEYFLHLDPAKTTDRWAVVIAHMERRFDPQSGAYLTHVIEDYSRAFTAPPGGFLDPDDIVDNYIFPLFNKFNIVGVSADAFFSLEQQKKFKIKRINFRELSFAGSSKNKIYETMRDFFITKRIELCNNDQQLAGELKNIKIKYTKKNPQIEKTPEDRYYPFDDLVDCLGGCIESMIKGAQGITRLPKIGTVRMGHR